MIKQFISWLKTEWQWRQIRRQQSNRAVRKAVNITLSGGIARGRI